MFKKIVKNKSGFSVIEAVVATYMVSLALVGVLTLVAQNLKVKQINTNMMVASMLAQEGIELVRNIRDTNWLKGVNWKNCDDLGSGCDIVQSGDGTYAIHYLSPGGGDYPEIFPAVDSITDAGARLNVSNTDFYQYQNGDPSIFSRLVEVQDSAGGEYIDVTCTVRWLAGGGQPYGYVAQTRLYNWR